MGQAMIRWRIVGICLAATTLPSLGHAADGDLYRTTAIVTGQGEKNRQIGFSECFDRILVRVTGDPRLPSLPAAKALREDAGSLVASYSYRDRMGGIPIHDEQGTYDRPHDLTCVYDPATLDPVLERLGSRPWIADRPPISVFLLVERGDDRTILTEHSAKGVDMRESFTAAAKGMAMEVRFPANGDLNIERWRLLAEPDNENAVSLPGKDLAGVAPLIGHLAWSDDDLGWVVDWSLPYDGRSYRWQQRGINFDEAFRVGVRGAAQVLSGNGQPR